MDWPLTLLALLCAVVNLKAYLSQRKRAEESEAREKKRESYWEGVYQNACKQRDECLIGWRETTDQLSMSIATIERLSCAIDAARAAGKSKSICL